MDALSTACAAVAGVLWAAAAQHHKVGVSWHRSALFHHVLSVGMDLPQV